MKTLITAFKGINKFGLALILAAVALVATQSAFTPKPVHGAYRYNPSLEQQDWDSENIDQEPSNYSLVGGGPVDCQNTDKICTYDLINGEFVQNSMGTLQ